MNCQFSMLLACATLLWVPTQDALAANATSWTSPSVDALIQKGLRHNSDGDYEAATLTWKRLGEVAPHHPAAHVHAVDTLTWLQIFEDNDTSFDSDIVRESEEGIHKAEAWVEEHPGDARAHLYLGHGLMNLGRLHGIRLRIYRAGVYGERARSELERALELEPSLTDAKYSIGLYAYYASMVPDLVQWLSFLWFVPSADAPLGLHYLDEVRQKGDLYQFTAAFYLSNIRTYHEKWLDAPLALTILEKLHAQHPQNSLIHFELLEALMLAGRYQEVLGRARELEAHPGTGSHDRGRANMGRIWRARAEMQLGQPERAWQLLERFGEEGPETPTWGHLWVEVSRGQIQDTMGEREKALAHYQRIVTLKLDPTLNRSAEIAAKGVKEPFQRGPEISAQDPRPANAL